MTVDIPPHDFAAAESLMTALLIVTSDLQLGRRGHHDA